MHVTSNKNEHAGGSAARLSWRLAAYVVRWRDEAGGYVEDRKTRVVWLQTAHWHADLRVPVDRPDFSGVASLEACSRDQLVWLARQPLPA